MFTRAFFVASFCIAAASAAAADDIVVTQIASASHPATKEIAMGAAIGFRVFFSKINANGGIHGRKVVLDVQDDHFIPAETVRLAKETVGDSSSLALFATIGTANLAALVQSEVLANNDMALVAPVSGLPVLLAAPNIFPIRANFIDELRQIVKHSGTAYRKRAVFLYIDTPVAVELSRELAKGMEQDGRKLLRGIAITPIPDAEKMKAGVVQAIDKALLDSPDMCVVLGPGNIGPAIIDAIRAKVGQKVVIYLMSGTSADDLIRMSTIKNVAGVIVSQVLPLPTDSGNRSVRQYLADMKKYAPKEKISHLSLEGYLGARVLNEGMKRAGTNLTRASLIASLNSLGKFDMGDFDVNYSLDGKRGGNFVDMTLINKSGYLIH